MMNYVEDHKLQVSNKINSPLKRGAVSIYREACESRLYSNIPIPQPCFDFAQHIAFLLKRGKGAEQWFNGGIVLTKHLGIFPPLRKGEHRGDFQPFNHQSPNTGVSIQFFAWSPSGFPEADTQTGVMIHYFKRLLEKRIEVQAKKTLRCDRKPGRSLTIYQSPAFRYNFSAQNVRRPNEHI
jgi:hypothetical protein